MGRLSMVVLVALALGGATSYLQTTLPHDVAPLANSAGPWSVLAFALAWSAPRPVLGAAAGALALLALVAGYYLVAGLRGYGVSQASVASWCAMAVIIGPALGAAAVVVRRSTGWMRFAAALVLPLVLVGEGIRSLAVIGDSTSPAYWTAQIVLGVLILAGLANPRGYRGTNQPVR